MNLRKQNSFNKGFYTGIAAAINAIIDLRAMGAGGAGEGPTPYDRALINHFNTLKPPET